jgi:protein-L-isoaspartate(D-aspartate) O-methyltransferase
MIDALELGPEAVVLEVGTGYGFQTALLAQVASRVISIERHRALAEKARANLSSAGVDNASVLVGDGWEGVPEHAPYEGIVVSAAADEIPDALREQLVEGGRMVIPVRAGQGDSVLLMQRSGAELVRKALLTPACFVPLVRGEPPG